MKSSHKYSLSFAGAALMFASVLVGTYWSFSQVTATATARQHLYDELNRADDLLSAVKDAETGFRGYLLSGDETFLAPYLSVRNDIIPQLNQLQQITLIDAASKNLKVMAPLIETKLAEIARVIALRRDHGQNAAAEAVTNGLGKRLMDAIREEARMFTKIENIALAQLEDTFTLNIRYIFYIIVTSSLFALVFAIWFAYLISQESRHRNDHLLHVETQGFLESLKKKNVELEDAKLAAEKANGAKSAFLSSMSHELRTPLNAILGFAQLMEADAPPPSRSQQQSLKQILLAGWHLLELVNEILDLALIESGKVMLSREPVSLAEVMLECQAMIEPQANQHSVQLTFPLLKIPYFVHVDRTRVKQCLLNLLSNAIKYNKPGGSVVLEYTLSGQDSIRITVRDTGAGLAAEQLAQLFQPFNRLGKENGAEEGSGIGLVVTKQLVELMGGTIGVDSVVGAGSAFWFELLLTPAPHIAVENAQPEPTVYSQAPDHAPLRTVLYVEDNPANVALVEQLIGRRHNLRLLCVANGNLGIEYARAHQPEVILMDINLPGISGLEAMKILRADASTAHIPIIAISANAIPRDVEHALEAGFYRYLTKPIIITKLMDTLDAALALEKKSPATSQD